MKALNYVLAAVFFLFAAVQYNDPDPLLWIAVYAAVGTLCLLAALGGHFKWLTGAFTLAVLVWMGSLAPGMADWARMGFPTIVGSMKAEAPHIELVREFLGLLTTLLSLLHLLRLAVRAPKA